MEDFLAKKKKKVRETLQFKKIDVLIGNHGFLSIHAHRGVPPIHHILILLLTQNTFIHSHSPTRLQI